MMMKLFTTALVDCAVLSKQLFESRKWIRQTGFALAFFAVATVAHALTLNYTNLPILVNVAITPMAPVVVVTSCSIGKLYCTSNR